MKTIDNIVLSAMVIAFLTMNKETFAQVGIGTTSPNTSSMLDIQSTTKGVLITRMTEAQRIGISAPATGLLVFDTTHASFWFNNGTPTIPAWKELSTGTPDKIVDDDGDTRIEVEQAIDEDKIRFTTGNASNVATERMTIDNAGNTRIGNGADNTYIEADGSLSYEGAATRWDDLKVPVTSLKEKGIKLPDWDTFKNGTYTFWFNRETNVDNEEELFFVVQMPHAWKQGSDILPHVHWTAATNVGTDKVVWGLEYTWSNVGVVFSGTTEISADTPIVAVGNVDAFKHAITSLGTITGSGKTLSSILMCRLFRKSRTGSGDTFTGKAALLEIDFHYEVDSDGSRTEYGK